MAIFLLDTNIIIDALNDKRGRNEFLLGLMAQGHLLACCPITVGELAGPRMQTFDRGGKTLSVPDTIVAAVAIHNRLTLVTDNTKDFPMKDLSLYPLVN